MSNILKANWILKVLCFLTRTIFTDHNINQCNNNIHKILFNNHNIHQCKHNIHQCKHNIHKCNHNIHKCNHNIHKTSNHNIHKTGNHNHKTCNKAKIYISITSRCYIRWISVIQILGLHC